MANLTKLLPFGAAACALALAIATGCSSTPATNTPDGEGSTSGADETTATTGGGDTTATTGGGETSGGDEGTTVGKKAVELKNATYVQGDGPKTIGEAKGKVVILDFWGTYCEPCKESFPKYQAMATQFGADLAIIAVSEDEADAAKVEDLKKFADKAKAKFVILWDKDKSIAKAYNPEKMPTAFIIDKEGKITSIHAGYTAGEDKKIAEEVKGLLK